MNSERERAFEIISNLDGVYRAHGVSKPTDALVESMLIYTGDLGLGITAGEWTRIWRIGDARLSRLHAILCGHLTDDESDAEVTAIRRLLAIRGRVRPIPQPLAAK